MGTFQQIAVTDPEYIKHVLVTRIDNYRKPTLMKSFVVNILGEGLILIDGEKHTSARKVINPAFKYNKIKELVPIFQNIAQDLINCWQNIINEHGGQRATLDVHNVLSRTTLDIICKMSV
ncbi:11-oxo-beta-amyrin 30-oxidase [Trichoplax sp. H2]|nr:11-oxo-beta-amyrin 30-oxidase [Trichoplax sp. H2]|eukprot:RDD40333.1 11-oxo-beta-amyrin 30-oxidase [Trichoplax sp. H2]